jgi:hypothetical protein
MHVDLSMTEFYARASRSTGTERDTESGNDYFGARYYASSMGRFIVSVRATQVRSGGVELFSKQKA